MRRLAPILLFVLAACGSDIASDRSAAISSDNAALRDDAQVARIANPEALACIKANASDEEWAIIRAEGPDAPAMLETVLGRESTFNCFRDNDVTVYL